MVAGRTTENERHGRSICEGAIHRSKQGANDFPGRGAGSATDIRVGVDRTSPSFCHCLDTRKQSMIVDALDRFGIAAGHGQICHPLSEFRLPESFHGRTETSDILGMTLGWCVLFFMQ